MGGKTSQEYVPGVCNIGSRGRAMRLATGSVVLAVSALVAITLFGQGGFRLLRLLLAFPAYAGLLSILEGAMSFCVFHASRGTYDLFERIAVPWGRSETRRPVESEEWRRRDHRKARLVKLEALVGAVFFGVLLWAF
ncbi:MAG TPA: hypothetical protein VIK88_00530 [Candidatus Bathyarchaeia archaeon]